MLDILYQDNELVAINKPHGLLVHRTKIANDADEFALQILRDQLNTHVHPVHRLDRKTGGVLLFALNTVSLKAMQGEFAQNQVKKTYWAIVRGYTNESGTINYPLKKENGMKQQAVTNYRTINQAEINEPFNGHSTSRYSLIRVEPNTGRMHQIRKHLSHIFHPIIGDRPHGCNKQNRLFKEKWNMTTMMLHAAKLGFIHPSTCKPILISGPVQSEFSRMCKLFGWEIE